MGKGDRKTAKGKRYNSSYGNARSATTKAAGTAAPRSRRRRPRPWPRPRPPRRSR